MSSVAKTRLKRKSFFVDEVSLRRARRALGVRTDAEAVRLSIERVTEMLEFWRFMERARGSVRRAEFAKP